MNDRIDWRRVAMERLDTVDAFQRAHAKAAAERDAAVARAEAAEAERAALEDLRLRGEQKLASVQEALAAAEARITAIKADETAALEALQRVMNVIAAIERLTVDQVAEYRYANDRGLWLDNGQRREAEWTLRAVRAALVEPVGEPPRPPVLSPEERKRRQPFALDDLIGGHAVGEPDPFHPDNPNIVTPQPAACATCGNRRLVYTEHYEGTDHGGFVPCPSCAPPDPESETP